MRPDASGQGGGTGGGGRPCGAAPEPGETVARRVEVGTEVLRSEVGRQRRLVARLQRDLQRERALVVAERQRAKEAEARAEEIERSEMWRASAPLRWLLSRARSRAPRGAGGPTGPRRAGTATRPDDLPARCPLRSLEPLNVFRSPEAGRTVSVVTGSVPSGGSASALDGRAGGIVLASVLAARAGAGLRVITREAPGDAADVHRLLSAAGAPADLEIDVLDAMAGSGAQVAVAPGDVFVATAWWAAAPVVAAVGRRQVVWLLADDERLLLASGDERVRCDELLADQGLCIVVDSEPVLHHLAGATRDAPGLADRALAFEPAFPAAAFYDDPGERASAGKRTFLFHAGPGDARSLAQRGLEAIRQAILQEVLDPVAWRFVFVGCGPVLPDLPGGPERAGVGDPSCGEYSRLLRSAHAGMSLLHSPHPGYPVLGLAASGAAVVTNTFGTAKTDLSHYCRNIVCVPPTVGDLVAGIDRAVAVSLDDGRRLENLGSAGLARDWPDALGRAVDRILDRTG